MFFLCFYVFLAILKLSESSGYFELQITTIQNPRGEVLDGGCCDGNRDEEGMCIEECDTFFRVCLKEYQSRITPDGECTFGNVTSKVLGGNSFTYPLESSNTRLKLPFDFAWTVSTILILKLYFKTYNFQFFKNN